MSYQPDVTKNNDLFTFCVEYGTGTYLDHFHCGFTTVNLLQQLEQINCYNGIFHLNAIYKIVKYLSTMELIINLSTVELI